MLRNYKQFQFIENIADGKHPVKKLVFLFHGYAQRASYMNNVVAAKMKEHLLGVKFISLNGLHECKGYEGKGRYDWLRYNGTQWNPDIIKMVASRSAEIIEDFIYDMLEEHELRLGDAALVGFSQGTRVCLHTSLRMKEKCAGVLGYSGALSLPGLIADELVSSPKVMLVHGSGDDVLHYTESIKAQKVLSGCGVDVTVRLLEGLGHKIDAEGVSLGIDFLKKQLKITANQQPTLD